jgi:hypothetical protein
MKIDIDKDLQPFIVAMCKNNGISYKAYVNGLLEKAIKNEYDPPENIRFAGSRRSSDTEYLLDGSLGGA